MIIVSPSPVASWAFSAHDRSFVRERAADQSPRAAPPVSNAGQGEAAGRVGGNMINIHEPPVGLKKYALYIPLIN